MKRRSTGCQWPTFIKWGSPGRSIGSRATPAAMPADCSVTIARSGRTVEVQCRIATSMRSSSLRRPSAETSAVSAARSGRCMMVQSDCHSASLRTASVIHWSSPMQGKHPFGT
jgi:hypothetical protein